MAPLRWFPCVMMGLAAWPVVAQAPARGTVVGILREDRGATIRGAEVLVQGTAIRVETSTNGEFVLSLPVGLQVLVFRKIGYRPQAISVAVDSTRRWLGTVVLEAGPFALPELTVTARYAKPERYANTTKYDDFYRRRKLGGGLFLDREAVDQRFVMHTHELLRGLPGVRVSVRPAGTGSMLWFSRCNESPPAIALFIDGTRIIPPWGIANGHGAQRTADRGTLGADFIDDRVRFVDEMLNTVSPAEIEAVEVFRGPAQLPAEFNVGDNCGAIVVWTRQGGYRVDPFTR